MYHEDVFKSFWFYVKIGHRYTREPRNASWFDDPALEKFCRYNIALCISGTVGHFPFEAEASADFAHMRLHCPQSPYASYYTDKGLHGRAKKIQKWNRDTYVCFDNDAMAFAPKNVQRAKEILEIRDVPKET